MSPTNEGLNAAQLQGGLVDPRVQAGDAINPEFMRMAFAMGSPNPFRPIEDIQVAREATVITCPSPTCQQSGEAAVYLYPVSQNEAGDLLLVCGNWACGYETVLRVVTRTFEPRPGRPVEGFLPPILKRGGKAAAPATKAKRPRRAAKGRADATPATRSRALPLTLQQAATQTGLPLRKLRRAVRKGQLRALKRAGEYRVNPADLAAYQQEAD